MSTDQSTSLRRNDVDNLERKLSQHTTVNHEAEKEKAAFRDLVYSTTFTHLGQNTHKYQDWFDDNGGDTHSQQVKT